MKALRMLLIVATGFTLVFASSAHATTANVVPNPGFEQGGCGNTPVICGWNAAAGLMSQVGTPGRYSLYLDCGPTGCYSNGFIDSVGVEARTDPAFCAPIGPGVHAASFWGQTNGDRVWLTAYFYQGADCTGSVGLDSLSGASAGQVVTGVLVAPPGTQSALFEVGASGACVDFCSLSGDFDDLDVESAALATPAITSFKPAAGPAGTSVDILGVNLTGATAVSFNGTDASFTVDSDSELHATVPIAATTGPVSVTTSNGTGTSKSEFTIQALPAPTISSFTPMSGPAGTSVAITGTDFGGATNVTFNGYSATFAVNSANSITAIVPSGARTGPISVSTPNGSDWSASSFRVNQPPTALFSFSCTAVTCTFDGATSIDPDGTIQSYSWTFGDGGSGSGKVADHVYAQTTSYAVKLTVTDDAGATTTASQTVTLISLTARGRKMKGLERVDLSWRGPSGTSYDVYRDGGKIATVQTTSYTDNLNRTGAGTYTYRVCAPGTATCSNTTTVNF